MSNSVQNIVIDSRSMKDDIAISSSPQKSAFSTAKRRPSSAGFTRTRLAPETQNRSDVHLAVQWMRQLEADPSKMSVCRNPKSFLEEIAPVGKRTIESLRREAMETYRERKHEGYAQSRAMKSQARFGKKKVVSPELIKSIMVELEENPPTPVPCKSKKKRGGDTPLELHEPALVPSSSVGKGDEPYESSMQRVSHIRLLRSLSAGVGKRNNAIPSPSSPPPLTRTSTGQGDSRPVASRQVSMQSSSALSASEKIERRAMLVRMESVRVLQMISEKKEKMQEFKRLRVERKELQNLQKVWLLTLAHMSRLCTMEAPLQENRRHMRSLRKNAVALRAVRRIERCYQKYKHQKAMYAHIKVRAAIHMLALLCWSRMHIRQRRRAVVVIKNFLRDSMGANQYTRKFYSYRNSVMKAQTWTRAFIVCTRARMHLLDLALKRSLAKHRYRRMKELRRQEARAVRGMMKSRYYGDTVRKVDRMRLGIYGMLSDEKQKRFKKLLIEQTRREERQREEAEEEKQRSIGAQSVRKSSDKSACKKNHLAEDLIHGCAFWGELRNILRVQRVRYRCETAAAFEELSRKMNKVISPEDARRFLSASGVDAELICGQSKQRTFATFYFLKGGGLDAVDTLARQIVYNEEMSPLMTSNPKPISGRTTKGRRTSK